MHKKLYVIALGAILGFSLTACVGSNNNTNGLSMSSSVTAGSCTNMSLGQTCTVNLTYNTNNTSGTSITTTQTAAPNSRINNFTTSSCPSPVASSANQQCNVTITCGNNQNSCNGNGTIIFTLTSSNTTSSSSVSTSVPVSATIQ